MSEILTTVEWLGVCVRARASVRGGVSGVRVRVSQQNVGRQVHRPYARGETTPRGLPSLASIRRLNEPETAPAPEPEFEAARAFRLGAARSALRSLVVLKSACWGGHRPYVSFA